MDSHVSNNSGTKSFVKILTTTALLHPTHDDRDVLVVKIRHGVGSLASYGRRSHRSCGSIAEAEADARVWLVIAKDKYDDSM